jgi:hypothetical protein
VVGARRGRQVRVGKGGKVVSGQAGCVKKVLEWDGVKGYVWWVMRKMSGLGLSLRGAFFDLVALTRLFSFFFVCASFIAHR